MWDVDWTDPHRELVGEHRARKEQEKQQEDKADGRHSISTVSSRSSGTSGLSRLRAKVVMQSPRSPTTLRSDVSASNIDASPSVSASSLSEPRTLDTGFERGSGHSFSYDAHEGTAGAASYRLAGWGRATEDKGPMSLLHKELDFSPPLYVLPAQPVPVPDRRTKLVKNAERIQSPETIMPRAPQSVAFRLRGRKGPIRFDLQGPITQPQISLTRSERGQPRVQSPESFSPRSSPSSPTRQLDPSLHLQPPWPPPLNIREPPKSTIDTEVGIDNTLPRLTPKHRTNESPQTDVALNVEPSPDSKESTVVELPHEHQLPNIRSLTQEARRMAHADPSEALLGLKESVCKSASIEEHWQCEVQKKWWMLSTLYHLDDDGSSRAFHFNAATDVCEDTMDSSNAPKEKLLAVHEAKNSALYLAALFPTNSVYHLSPSPLSPKLATNIIPVHSAKVSSTFPSLPEWFDTTFSISLPSLCCESELGDALKSISRCLKPGGTCNFIVIDPVPAGAVLGDGFRTWLTENVLRNLHKKSRCLRPSARFARLLGDASLRGPGSTLARTKFYANPENVQRQRICSDYNTTTENMEEQKHQETRAELRSLVGRMLWREVWGEFVTAKNWWWDDPVCMKECLELGTFWEYHYIQGVRV